MRSARNVAPVIMACLMSVIIPDAARTFDFAARTFTVRVYAQGDFLARARALHKQVPLIDGHNDLPWRLREDKAGLAMDVVGYNLRGRTGGHTDFDRLKQGMLGGQFWSVYIPGEIKDSGYARVQLERYRLGTIEIERLVQAQDRLSQAEEGAITARFDYLRSKAQIEALIGRTL